MGIDDCYLLGQLLKTHGLRGELIANIDADHPEEYQKLESVFLEQNGNLVPFFIESIAWRGNKAFIAFEDIQTVDEAASLLGCPLYLPLDQLPELPDGKYYFHQLIGLRLYDHHNLIGEVKQLYDLPNNRLLGVDHQGNEILVPLEDGIIQSVNLMEQRINAQLPDGLLDVFLEK